jgi:hypothetical protein
MSKLMAESSNENMWRYRSSWKACENVNEMTMKSSKTIMKWNNEIM